MVDLSTIRLDPPRVFQVAVVRKAIGLWVHHGIRANTAYTPSNMAATAGNITGRKYGRTKAALTRAADDLKTVLEANGWEGK